jgi:hypothetical protein
VAADDHVAILRVLAKRHHDLAGLCTQATGRMHTVLCLLIPGGLPRRLSPARAAGELRKLRPAGADPPVAVVAPVDSTVTMTLAARPPSPAAVRATPPGPPAGGVVVPGDTGLAGNVTTGPRSAGARPWGRADRAAHLVGSTGDVSRFPSAGHYARFTGTAPIEVSSGDKKRDRLNPRCNRQPNRAIHMIAATQVPNDTPGRAYYLRRQAEGKSRKEATRALERRISDVVCRYLLEDAAREQNGSGGQSGTTLEVERGRLRTLRRALRTKSLTDRQRPYASAPGLLPRARSPPSTTARSSSAGWCGCSGRRWQAPLCKRDW